MKGNLCTNIFCMYMNLFVKIEKNVIWVIPHDLRYYLKGDFEGSSAYFFTCEVNVYNFFDDHRPVQ